MVRVVKKVLGEMTEVDDNTVMTEFDPPDDTFLGDPDISTSEFSNEKWTYKGQILNQNHPLRERPFASELDEQMWIEFGDSGKNRFPQEIPNYPDAGVQIEPIIKLQPGHESDTPCRTPRKLDMLQHKELLAQLTYYLQKGFIKPSSSPYGACILFVPKKNGKFRMCYDYRALNKITIKDKSPLPDAEQIIEQLEGAKYFSQLDMAHGYHQCILAPEDREKTAFRTTFGSYEWTVMTFGLTNAVPAFIRHITNALQKHLGICCMAFVDDIIIYSKDLESHERDVRAVLNALCDAKLCVNWVKSKFNTDAVEYLGLRISRDGISPLQNKVEAIQSWEPPTTTYHLRSFLGAVGYYRKFIHGFSRIAHPLTELTKDDPSRITADASNVTNAKFGRRVKTQSFKSGEWTAACQSAFETL
jgi:hypothetical protein